MVCVLEVGSEFGREPGCPYPVPFSPSPRALLHGSFLTLHRPQSYYHYANTLKLKLSHYTPQRRLGEIRYSSYSFSTSPLYGGVGSASGPGRALAPGKGAPVPIGQEAGWAPGPVWTQRLEEKYFRLCRGSNLDRPVFQPVARLSYLAHHYADMEQVKYLLREFQ
jgi:hypothetical protein